MALGQMNGQNRVALRTGPFFLLVFNKAPDPEFLNMIEVLKHAHPVFETIALIQIFQSFAGKAGTTGTESLIAGLQFIAIHNFAGHAIIRFSGIIAPASLTGILFPDIRAT